MHRLLAKVSLQSLEHGCTWEATFDAWIKGGEDKAQSRPLTLTAGKWGSGEPGEDKAQSWLLILTAGVYL